MPRTSLAYFRILAFALAASAPLSCGKTDPTSSVSESPVDQTRVPILIVHTGYNSCGLNSSPVGSTLHSNFIKVRDRLATAYNQLPKYLIGCYTPYKVAAEGKSHYLSSFNPEVFEKATPYETIGLVQQLSGGRPADVYIVGHSYGGWLGMKISQGLPSPAFKIKFLATLDPISQVHCNAYYFAKEYFSGGHPGCQEPPRDIGVSHRRYIRDRVDYWMNFYQVSYERLHSNRMPTAHFNFGIWFETTTHTAHTDLAGSKQGWSRINQYLLKKLEKISSKERAYAQFP